MSCQFTRELVRGLVSSCLLEWKRTGKGTSVFEMCEQLCVITARRDNLPRAVGCSDFPARRLVCVDAAQERRELPKQLLLLLSSIANHSRCRASARLPGCGRCDWLTNLRTPPNLATDLGAFERGETGSTRRSGAWGAITNTKRPFRHGGRLPCACEPCTAWTLARYGAVRQWCSEACRHRMAECAAKLG